MLEVCTLGAKGGDGGARILCVCPEPEGCEPPKGSNCVGRLLPTATHQETLQLVRVNFLEAALVDGRVASLV